MLDTLVLTPQMKIGEGGFRTVYRIPSPAYLGLPEPEVALKVLKPEVDLRLLVRTHKVPAREFFLRKYGIEDINAHELEVYQSLLHQLPIGYTSYFAGVLDVDSYQGVSVQIAQLVTNSDGHASRRLAEYGQIKDPNFWRGLRDLELMLHEKRIFLPDLHDENILVQESGNGALPVVADFKRQKAYKRNFEFWKSGWRYQSAKMKRRLNRLRASHGGAEFK